MGTEIYSENRSSCSDMVFVMKNPNTAQYWHWREDLEKFDINIHVQFKLEDQHKNTDFLSRLECGQCDINHEDPKLKSNVKHYKEEENLRALKHAKIIFAVTK